MRKYVSFLFMTLIASSILVSCQKDEEDQETTEILDNSLIITRSTVSEYVIVSPSTGIVLAKVQPNVIGLENWVLGYMSQKAVITSKEPGGSFVKVIYTCGRTTGDNLFQVTSEDDFDVMQMDVSLVGPNIVFAAQEVGNESNDQIHRINEDGTGYQQLTFKDEGIVCPGRVATKMVFAYMPCWSPDGTKIAFNGKLREIDTNHPHDAVIIMDADGSNKQVLFSVPMEEADYKDICWTHDGKFLVFLMNEGNDVKVKVLNVDTQAIIDISSHMTVNGLHTTNLWTSPNSNRIAFNKYEPGGGDLYVIGYTVTDTDQFVIEGAYTILASHNATGLHFGKPNWQIFPINNN